MNMTSIRAAFLVLLTTGFLTNIAYAANLPAGYPKVEEFDNIGTVDSAVYDNKIVIGDQEYLIAKSIIIVKPGKKSSTLKDLKQGSTAGVFSIPGDLNTQPVVKEIWILPKGFKN